MNYLKTFKGYLKKHKLFESNIESYIDMGVIENVKDLSLDYLDDGLELEFIIDYHINGDPSKSINLLTGKYSHNSDILEWLHKSIEQSLIEEVSNINKNYLYYCFYLNRNGEYDCVDSIEDLNKSISDFYPDLNIFYDRFENSKDVQALRNHLISEEGMSENDFYSIKRKGYKYYGICYVYDHTSITGEEMEFISCTEEEAFKIAEENISNLIDDDLSGSEIFKPELYFEFDAINKDSLINSIIDEPYYRMSWKDYDIKSDEYGDMDEEGFDNFIKMMKDDINYDIRDYIETNFGEESLKRIIKDNLKDDYLKIMTDGIIKSDGLGHVISSYDGQENIEYYKGVEYSIFRLN